jgi:hypothetical protein
VKNDRSQPEPDGSDGVTVIERSLRGTPEEIQLAAGMLLCHKTLRTKVCSRIRKKFASLSPWQLADVWTDAVMNVREMALQRRYRVDEPLEAILITLTRRRATDVMRRLYGRSPRKPKQPSGKEPSGGSAATADVEPRSSSERPREWTLGELAELCPDAKLEGDAKCEELLGAIRAFAESLPHKQQLALRAFARAWPHPTDSTITNIVREVAPQASLKSVQRALQEAFGRLRVWLAEQCPEWDARLRRFLSERELRRQQRQHATTEPASALSHVSMDDSATPSSTTETPKEHDGER